MAFVYLDQAFSPTKRMHTESIYTEMCAGDKRVQINVMQQNCRAFLCNKNVFRVAKKSDMICYCLGIGAEIQFQTLKHYRAWAAWKHMMFSSSTL